MKKGLNNNTIGTTNYVDHSMSILDRIHELLELKFEGKQKELAKKLGKTEPEVSKWLNGIQNFTLFTLSKLEEAFEAPIICVCTNSEKSTFVQVKSTQYIEAKQMATNNKGELIEMKGTYEDSSCSNYNENFKIATSLI